MLRAAARTALLVCLLAAALAQAAATDSLPALPAPSPAPKAVSDSARDTIPFWHRNCFGIRVGWTLGDADFFDGWSRSLPGGLSALGVPDTLFAGDTAGGIDTVRLRFEVKESPAQYNVDFPLGLSYTLATRRHNTLTIDASFVFQRKSWKALLRPRSDTLGARLNLEQSLGLYATSVGVSWSQTLRTRFFSVDNTDRTALTVGLAACPFAYLAKRTSISRESDGRRLLSAAADSAALRCGEVSAVGGGLSWTVGGTVVKKLSATGGLETTLCYTGRWFYFADIGEQALQAPAVGGGEGLSVVCHRFAIQLALLKGRAPRQGD